MIFWRRGFRFYSALGPSFLIFPLYIPFITAVKGYNRMDRPAMIWTHGLDFRLEYGHFEETWKSSNKNSGLSDLQRI